MARIEKRTKFLLDGAKYEHVDPVPEMEPGTAQRFTYGEEPEVIAQVPLAGGRRVEVHGYAAFYTPEWVTLEWTGDNYQHFSCSTTAGNVQRPVEGEWHGKWVPR
ncbi:MAG: hypothetical protein ABWY04_01170 [Arthrobacter sp.]